MYVITNTVLNKKQYFKQFEDAYLWLFEAYKEVPSSVEVEELVNSGTTLEGTVHIIEQK